MDFIEHLKRYLSENEINDLLNSLNEKRTNSFVLNTGKMSADQIESLYPNIRKHAFLENAYYYDKDEYELGKSYLFDNGAYYIMDASSMLVAYLLEINKGDLVLDMCAAPGGKSIYLSLKNNDFTLISNDISYERCLKMSSNVEKLGLDNIIITNYDFTKKTAKYTNVFDKIILDAPCSGSAMFRKNDLAKKDWSYEKVISLSKIQKELIANAFSMLKKDGILVYSTCSFSYEENEEVIEHLLKNEKDAVIVPIPLNKSFFPSKNIEGGIHLFPNKYKGEGQFICIVKKTNGDSNFIKSSQKNQKIKNEIITNFKLNFHYYYTFKDKLYGSNSNLDIFDLKIIRYGIDICELNKNHSIPSFNLAHYLNNSSNCIELDDNERALYLSGQVIRKNLKIKNDYYIVSYNGLNLGFAKYIDGVLKNLYPKGLRH